MKGRVVLVLCILALSPLQAQNRNYTLDELLKEPGMSLRWDPFFASGMLLSGDHRLAFYTGFPGEQGIALFDGREILTLPAPYLEAGNIVFPAAFVTGAKSAFSSALRPPEAEKGRFRVAAIIIDPGHGGKDSGAMGTHTVNGKALKSVEKDITLAVSLELAALLRAAWPEKRVSLTRTGDTYPSLEDRVNIANTVSLKDNEAIIYVSIHANASPSSKSARGYEVWYLPPETNRELIDRRKYAGSTEILPVLNDMLQAEFIAESTDLGRHILRRFGEVMGNSIPSRGLKAENWYVVRNARMPAVLVELGFVTNSADAALMADPAGLKRFAEGLYKGIADFTAEFERSGGSIAP